MNSQPMTRRRSMFLTGSTLMASMLPPALAETKPKADPYADAVLVDGEPPPPQEGSFCFAVLPDTQYYSESFPNTYVSQTTWIVEQRKKRNIAAVLHLGDMTNNNSPDQWKNAQAGMKVLSDAGMPYCIIPGNHDYSKGGSCRDRTSLMSEYFPVKEHASRPHWGGNYDREPDLMENNYQLVQANGRKFLLLGLEFGPRNDVIRWANRVVAKHKDREVILLTHAYIYHDDTRYNWKKDADRQTWNPHSYPYAGPLKDDINDGEQLWEKLVSKHENFILTLNGHVIGDGLGRMESATPAGRSVPQVLVNFQMKPKGGDGWLRLVEMRKDGSAQVYDFSPTRKQRNESAQNQFTLQLPPIA